MALTDLLRNRMQNRFSRKISAAPIQVHQGDALLRSNIPPLMGRRDAAYDRACELLKKDLFAMSENARLSLYRTVEELLQCAEQDTGMIVTMLTSPDTRSRERQMMEFMRAARLTVGALSQLFSGVRLLQEEDDETASFAGLPEEETFQDEELLSNCEISVIHRVRAFLDNSNARIVRYREYTGKSFSQTYAERYRKSLSQHHDLFVRNTQDWE